MNREVKIYLLAALTAFLSASSTQHVKVSVEHPAKLT